MGKTMLKWLVGGACAVIIAASGVYLSGQYSAHMERIGAVKAAVAAEAYMACRRAVADDSGYSGTDISAVSDRTRKADLCAIRYPELVELGSPLQFVQRKARIAKMQASSIN